MADVGWYLGYWFYYGKSDEEVIVELAGWLVAIGVLFYVLGFFHGNSYKRKWGRFR